jgi:predicted PurR-regulated permease PerM
MSILDDLWNWVTEQINKVIGFSNNIYLKCVGLFNNLINWVNDIYGWLSGEITKIWAWIDYLKNQVASIVGGAVEAAIGYAKAAVLQVVGGIQEQITAIYKSIGGFYDWTLRQISNLENFLLDKIQSYFDYLNERVDSLEAEIGKGPDLLSIQDKVLSWVFAAIEKAW